MKVISHIKISLLLVRRSTHPGKRLRNIICDSEGSFLAGRHLLCVGQMSNSQLIGYGKLKQNNPHSQQETS